MIHEQLRHSIAHAARGSSPSARRLNTCRNFIHAFKLLADGELHLAVAQEGKSMYRVLHLAGWCPLLGFSITSPADIFMPWFLMVGEVMLKPNR